MKVKHSSRPGSSVPDFEFEVDPILVVVRELSGERISFSSYGLLERVNFRTEFRALDALGAPIWVDAKHFSGGKEAVSEADGWKLMLMNLDEFLPILRTLSENQRRYGDGLNAWEQALEAERSARLEPASPVTSDELAEIVGRPQRG